MTRSNRVVFVDKDGTLIEDLPYNVDPTRIRFAPGARDAIRRLGEAGFDLAVVTNQSGVARGYFSEADLEPVAAHLADAVAAFGSRLVGFYACPHLPEGVNEYAVECDCRKPLPGLLRRAAEELGVELGDSWFIGDTWMDAVAGREAGCRTIMVGPDARTAHRLAPERRPDHAVADLAAAVEIILEDAAVGAVAAGPMTRGVTA
ncbi:MAG: D-glycero-alpha-D-manno-heptose-1,7-bisphosphate 7-phosphatase [Chloroflexota bacterium]